MAETEQIIEGTLISDSLEINVRLSYASKYSLFIEIPEDSLIRNGTIFEKLVIEKNDTKYELGSCRFLLESNICRNGGRIIFINNIYDFDKFFTKNEFINIQRMSNELGAIISQKTKISETFKTYTSNLIYDLKVYKHFFDDIDRSLKNEPEHVKESVIQTILNTEGVNFMNFFQEKLNEMETIIKPFTRNEHTLHGFYLRKQLWDIILCSEFMTRTNLKPRGYAGDSEMMKMIYENSYRGKCLFSMLLYKISLEHPASQAVRNRRIMISKILKKIQPAFSSESDSFRFMSVACGSADELGDLFTTADDIERYNCILLDQDINALNEACNNVVEIEKRIGYKVKVQYMQDSVRTMLKTKDMDEKWGTFHFIYSMGLFDYLTPPVAKAVMEKLYTMLKPGGQILVGNFNYKNKSRWFMEYWHDWVLFYRDENELIDLLRDTDAVDVSVKFEETNSQMFLMAKKSTS